MKFLFQILLSLKVISTCFGSFVPENHPGWKILEQRRCGENMKNRIIGGHFSYLGGNPWILLVGTEALTMFGKIVTFYCGGSLISPNYGVSAGHCITATQKRTMNIMRAGEYNLDEEIDCINNECAELAQDRSITRIIVHEGYNKPVTQNDIILLYTSVPFYMNSFVNTICLPKSNMINETFEGSLGLVSGWGIYNLDDKDLSNLLRVVSVPVISNAECIGKFKKSLTIKPTQLCAGGHLGSDSCAGDSGGPLMTVQGQKDDCPRPYLIGIVSLGLSKCGGTTKPGVYTRVTSFEKWILDMVVMNERLFS